MKVFDLCCFLSLYFLLFSAGSVAIGFFRCCCCCLLVLVLVIMLLHHIE